MGGDHHSAGKYPGLLIAGIGATGMTSLTISSADSGKVSVGKSAIEDYVAEIAKEVYGVYGS